MPFKCKDYIELNINLLTDKGVVKKVKWSNLLVEEIPLQTELPDQEIMSTGYYQEFQNKREVLDYDLSRFCELEIVKSKWLTLKGNLTDYDLILNKINALFEPYLKVNDVQFDDVGYLIFKIKLIAVKKGQLPSYAELGILIEVISENEPIVNEVKKNSLIFDRKNQLQLRIGDHMIFYLSKNK